MDLLIEIYVGNIYDHIHIATGTVVFRSVGPSATAGEVMTYGRKEGRKARKYIRMNIANIITTPSDYYFEIDCHT